MTAQERPDLERRFDQLLSAIADRSCRPHHRDADMILLGAVLENALREVIHNEKKACERYTKPKRRSLFITELTS